MDLSKYELPNFFIKKKGVGKQTGYILDGNVFYIRDAGKNQVFVEWTVSVDFPRMASHASKIGQGYYSKEIFERDFMYINRLQGWKKSVLITAIFNSEDVI